MNYMYNRGLDELHDDWATGDFLWLLAQDAYVPNRDHDFISSVTNEVSVASYVRVVPANPSRTINDTKDLIEYKCDPVDFGDLENTQSARWLILARDVTNDADSPLICALDLGSPKLLGTDFVVYLHPDGFAASRQVTQ